MHSTRPTFSAEPRAVPPWWQGKADDEDAPTEVAPMRFDAGGEARADEVDPEDLPTFAFDRSAKLTVEPPLSPLPPAEGEGMLGRRLGGAPRRPEARPMFESLLPAVDRSVIPAGLGSLRQLLSSPVLGWIVCVVSVVLVSMGLGALVYLVQRAGG